MQSERTVTTHEVIYIHHTPFSKSVLAQPLHQGLEFVAGLEMRRGQHFVLDDYQVFVCVQLLRHWQFWDNQADWSLNQQQESQQHLLVAFVDGLVLHWISKALIIIGEIEGSIRYKSKLLILSILVILAWTLILIPSNRQPSNHKSINNSRTFCHLLHKLLVLGYLEGVTLLLCHLYRLQHSFFQPGLPVFVHEGSVAIDYGVETGLVYFEQVIGDCGWVDAVVGHHSFWKVAEGFAVCFSVDAAESERNVDFFGELNTQQVMSLSKRLHPFFQLLADLLSVYHSINRINPTISFSRFAYLGYYLIDILCTLCQLLQTALLSKTKGQVTYWQAGMYSAEQCKGGYNFFVDHYHNYNRESLWNHTKIILLLSCSRHRSRAQAHQVDLWDWVHGIHRHHLPQGRCLRDQGGRKAVVRTYGRSRCKLTQIICLRRLLSSLASVGCEAQQRHSNQLFLTTCPRC